LDPCFFLIKDTILVLYTDGGLLYAKNKNTIDEFVKILRNEYNLALNDPDPIDDFLGIHFLHKDNGELHMSQAGLIYAVTDSADILKGRVKNTHTPAAAILHDDADILEHQ
jgi:hypothetical protein